MNFENTWNFELRDYYHYKWNTEKLDKGRERLESYYTRINKYINKFKKKELIFEYGCFNMNVVKVELTNMYKLTIYLGDGKKIILDLVNIIEYGTQLRYNKDIHKIYFINY